MQENARASGNIGINLDDVQHYWRNSFKIELWDSTLKSNLGWNIFILNTFYPWYNVHHEVKQAITSRFNMDWSIMGFVYNGLTIYYYDLGLLDTGRGAEANPPTEVWLFGW